MPAIFTSMNTRCGRKRSYSARPSTAFAARADLVALELEQLTERAADAGLVVDDEDATGHGRPWSCRA